jgi:hypothetical protein
MMERSKAKAYIFFLFLLVLAGVVLAFAAFFWGWKYAPVYQSLPHNVQPASTPANLGELTARVEALEAIHNQNLKAFEWQLDQKLIILSAIAVFISFVAGFLGYKTYDGLDKTIEQEVRRALDQALYQLDPTNLKIWVITRKEAQPLFNKRTNKVEETLQVDAEMEKVEERLRLSGLVNVETREAPDKHCYRGVTIVPIFNPEMEKDFMAFLERNRENLDKERAAFVLYTLTYTVEKSTLAAYPNLATANMPPTAASMVLVVGRGLKNIKP